MFARCWNDILIGWFQKIYIKVNFNYFYYFLKLYQKFKLHLWHCISIEQYWPSRPKENYGIYIFALENIFLRQINMISTVG